MDKINIHIQVTALTEMLHIFAFRKLLSKYIKQWQYGEIFSYFSNIDGYKHPDTLENISQVG